jgi:hypothetical protein
MSFWHRSEPPSDLAPRPGAVVRSLLGGATVVSLVFGWWLGGDARILALSSALGTVWLAWDLLTDYVIGPVAGFLGQVLSGQVGVQPSDATRPSLEDTIRLLENHIDHHASRHVQVNAALRLAEIYRTVKHDPERAHQVVERVRARFPDATELKRVE